MRLIETQEDLLLLEVGGVEADLSDAELDEYFSEALQKALSRVQPGPVALLPPDGTRFHSRAGYLTDIASRILSSWPSGDRLGMVMPALGTHMPMTAAELGRMFPGTPLAKFRGHDWRRDVLTLGRLEADWVEKTAEGAVRFDWPVQVNKALLEEEYSLIVSLGQVVPHEVIGMANHLKNLFVGTGGKEAIDKSHFTGAAYGMERMMGRINTPVRALFDEGYRRFGNLLPPILWVLTVVGSRSESEARRTGKPRGSLAVRGLYVGFGRSCFEKAAELARRVNVDLLDEPIQKAVVYLEPEEFRTTWLGNKAVYRTRMAMADGGELLILAPGLERFGEDPGIDTLIRKHGYRPAAEIRSRVESDQELQGALSAAAHLIHGSSENRFTVRYCPGPGVSRKEIESVGYEWGDLAEALARYDIHNLSLGWNTLPDGERIFFVPNPALGLWAEKRKFLT
ncbi:lactate racemase domain-containing protein [Gracilinema caldarium]|uniref:lactate racemase domain-containing protein n=1 Tax=Gracilinema caldarium TaxID=215591 RepID=UPI0026EE53D0|nr:lactate racemase domain-containing protein [Gracilinema caldarium]